MDAWMIMGCTIEFLTGSICIILGLLIGKKQKVSLLHDYHYSKVREQDIPAYAREMGTGIILIGAGIWLTGLLEVFSSPLWWVPLVIGFVTGIIVINRAQKKYNGSWIS